MSDAIAKQLDTIPAVISDNDDEARLLGRNHSDSLQLNPNTRPEVNVMQTLIGNCLCTEQKWLSPAVPPIQFIQLDGIECIALGAVTDEQSAIERVTRTVNQLATSIDQLICVGYLKDGKQGGSHNNTKTNDPLENFRKLTEVFPLQTWKDSSTSNDQNQDMRKGQSDLVLPLSIGSAIEQLKQKDYTKAFRTFKEILRAQREHKHPDDRLLEGITVHNIAVVHLLAGNFEMAFPIFKEAVRVKKASFGADHPETAVSLVETAILYFAFEQYEEALQILNDALKLRTHLFGSSSPKVAMVLNNLACVHLAMGNPLMALGAFQEARNIQQVALGSSQMADIHLLHMATTLSNIGYIKLQVKNYEEARAVLEDALLIQQSVLGDGHKAVKDTLSNLEFANAFHS